MGRYKNLIYDKKIIEQMIKEGRGQGRGINYLAWLLVQNVPSMGNVYRVNPVWVANRVIHLLSQLEYFWFLVLEFVPDVIDICEQVPALPQSETIELARELGIRHPSIRGANVVVTTDFRVTRRDPDGKEYDEAYSVKYAEPLNNERNREKLALEQACWNRKGVKLRSLTEEDLNKTLVRNIQIIRDYKQINRRIQLERKQLFSISEYLTKQTETKTEEFRRNLG